jgi:hypothetical protein
MSLIATEKSLSFKPVPVGNHIGRCYSVIDLGTQSTYGSWGSKVAHKIRIGWELFGEDDQGQPLTIDMDGKIMPLTITKRYTLSLHKKAVLRNDLASWRGRDFDQAECIGYDVSSMIDKYCLINVTNTTNADGVIYSDVASISPLPSVLKNSKPDPVHANQIFDFSNPDMTLFATFSNSLQETIMKAHEAELIINQSAGAIIHRHAPASTPTLPSYPNSQFFKNLPSWCGLVEGGKKTVEQIIAMVNTKAQLSAEQIEILKATEEKEVAA